MWVQCILILITPVYVKVQTICRCRTIAFISILFSLLLLLLLLCSMLMYGFQLILVFVIPFEYWIQSMVHKYIATFAFEWHNERCDTLKTTQIFNFETTNWYSFYPIFIHIPVLANINLKEVCDSTLLQNIAYDFKIGENVWIFLCFYHISVSFFDKTNWKCRRQLFLYLM